MRCYSSLIRRQSRPIIGFRAHRPSDEPNMASVLFRTCSRRSPRRIALARLGGPSVAAGHNASAPRPRRDRPMRAHRPIGSVDGGPSLGTGTVNLGRCARARADRRSRRSVPGRSREASLATGPSGSEPGRARKKRDGEIETAFERVRGAPSRVARSVSPSVAKRAVFETVCAGRVKSMGVRIRRSSPLGGASHRNRPRGRRGRFASTPS